LLWDSIEASAVAFVAPADTPHAALAPAGAPGPPPASGAIIASATAPTLRRRD